MAFIVSPQGRGTQQSVIGEALPGSDPVPFYLLYTVFERKGYPFHIPRLDLCIPFVAVNATPLKGC